MSLVICRQVKKFENLYFSCIRLIFFNLYNVYTLGFYIFNFDIIYDFCDNTVIEAVTEVWSLLLQS